jgi:hypothetical protein
MSNGKKYPTVVWSVLADDVRQETGSKIFIIGAYTGNDIIITPSQPVPAGQKIALPLTLLAVFEGGDGEYEARLNIYDPLDKPVMNATLKFNAGDAHTINAIFKLPTFSVSESGQYRAVLSFGDGEPYELKFKVKIAQALPVNPAP